ncbi:hypothetical protein GCM10008015_09800 [Flavobacterium palustre]|uniref:histidine kinase n=1 Tax=Flavobacterium palustre TaxID=1476463 RepID=A0ABQ1HDR6_9FLAO|nr:PAS domain S-box protein [Flavobacterium palustre]GGA71128.1 hypothetical protein GCM10008015_09800 [Flavobacterium palustre]
MINRKQASLELTLLVFIMSLFIIGVGIYGVLKIRESNNNSKELYTDRIVPMDQLADIRFYTSNIIATAHQIDGKQIGYKEALQKITQSQDSIKVNWENYQQSYLTNKEKQLVLNAKIQIDKSDNTIEKLKLALKEEDANLLDSILKNELYPNLNSVIIEASNLLRLQVKIGKAINQNNDSIYKAYTSEIIWIILIAFGFAVPFLYYLIRKNSAIVSDLKLNDAKLFLTEKNYRNLIEYAGEAILILNEETEIIDLNEAACTLFGYTREELLRINISELVPSDEIEKQVEDVALIRKNKFAQISRKIRRKDGSFIQTEISNRLMDGKGFFAIIRDVTARKNAEEVIKKSEEKYRYLFDNSPAYIIIWDLETLEILEINNAVLCKYGYSKEEWSKMSVLDYRPKEDYSKIEEFAKYMLVNEEPIVTRNWRHHKKNGDEMIMEIASHKIEYNNRKAILSLANDVTNQIKAEEKLKEREAQLDLFIGHSPASLAMFDTKMHYIKTSNRWIEDYNLSGQNIIGKSHYEVFPEIGQEWKDIHQRCLQGVIEKREEDSFLRANGNVDWVKWEIRPWHKSTGEIGGVIMFTEVITERKKATEMFKNQFDNAPDIILYVNKLYKIEAINKDSPIGKTVDELIGADCIEVLPEESRKDAKERLDRCFATGENQEFENQLNFGRWVRSRLVPIEVNGEVQHVMIFATDITERKQAEIQLLQGEEKYRVLTENISDAILLLDKEGGILYQSPSAERISGRSFEDVKEKSFTEFLVSDELFRGQLFLKEILENPNVPKQNQFRINHKKGHEIWIEGTAINLLENESVKAIILNYRDVTDKKIFENELIRYNSELKKTNAELDRFVYSASHDLRAPLKSMLGLIYVTKECADPEDSELHERLAMLNNSVGKLDDFIEDILHYSRNARLVLDKDEINFRKIIEEIKGSHKFIEGIKGVQLHVEISSSGLFVSDYRRLGVVLNNLLSNALKYRDLSKEKSFVNIIIRSDRTNAIIVIEDNGVGIASDDKEKIFEMFYRGTTLSSGSGLGLYIVKEALEKLGGTINVESEQDKGTKFIVEIPNQISNLN